MPHVHPVASLALRMVPKCTLEQVRAVHLYTDGSCTAGSGPRASWAVVAVGAMDRGEFGFLGWIGGPIGPRGAVELKVDKPTNNVA
eukprot:13845808-Alexandrium_andersonii.AAC.1